MSEVSTQERFKRGAADAPRYFQFMADFIGFTPADAEAIRETRPYIEPHLAAIIGEFYAQLLRFPATRKHFLKKDGTVDQDYLELRMQHQANFWRRTLSGAFDDDYARFVDYVGRAHTSQGADPRVYIPERYVIGMVGFVQQRIAAVLANELDGVDEALEARGLRAWSAFLAVLTEQLSRVYGEGKEPETYEPKQTLNAEPVHDLAEDSYERAAGLIQPAGYRRVQVGPASEIAEGERKIIEADGHSIGVFHLKEGWAAFSNSCLHRGGPVCTGALDGTTLTCPWHGYQYDVTTGQLLLDHSTALPVYRVTVEDSQVYVDLPVFAADEPEVSLANLFSAPSHTPEILKPDQFRVAGLKPGHSLRVAVGGRAVAVYNIDGTHYATQDECTHADGPLSEGDLDGCAVICPWHASAFDVRDGSVLIGPATEPLRTYRVVIEGEIGRVEG